MDTTQAHATTPGLRNQMTLLGELLAGQDAGLLVAVDEIHHRQRDELRELATTLQHLVREERNIALVGAGLPAAVHDVLSAGVLTFLRRANLHPLGPVPMTEVADAIVTPIAFSKRLLQADDHPSARETRRRSNLRVPVPHPARGTQRLATPSCQRRCVLGRRRSGHPRGSDGGAARSSWLRHSPISRTSTEPSCLRWPRMMGHRG